MGRHHKACKGKKRQDGGGRPEADKRTDVIEKIDMNNERFFAYYKAQNIIPEEEWGAFVDSMRQHLPTTFRVAGSRQTATSLNATIANVHVPSLSDVVFEGAKIPPPVQIPWYPDGLAWQFNVPKKVLRRSTEFKKFHAFLVSETEVGNVSRQEAVSMLPPLFLDVQPHHRVMDMCAAPGSKTAQLLEALHVNDTVSASSMPSGLLLANDSDSKRTHLLIHQSGRLPSPSLMVTNLDASNYPSIKIPLENGGEQGKMGQLQFDRILCDVPCSGDGTMRKNMGIWKSWQPNDGNGLHNLQVRILQRAMRLLKPDGRIVYSTCSLNPVENEAVVAEALNSNKSFHLVDVSSKMPELVRRPGMTSWRATADRTGQTTFSSYEEFQNSSLDATLKAKLAEGHWPPANAESLNLDRSMRIYPHLQDTGGFFVAVLERKHRQESSIERKRPQAEGSEHPAKRLKLDETVVSEPSPLTEPLEVIDDTDDIKVDTPEETVVPESKEAGTSNAPLNNNGWFKENPYTFLPPGDPIVKTCLERLHIKSEFPSSNVLVRNPTGDAARTLYITNDVVKTIIENNDYTRIRLTAAGTKVFAKQEAGKGSEAQFRVLGEGLPIVLPYIEPSQILEGDLESLKILIESYYPLCSRFKNPFKETVEARTAGSHVVRFPAGKFESATLTHDIVLPIWKSNVSLTLMIDKKAKSALSLRLYGVDITGSAKAEHEKIKAAAADGGAEPMAEEPVAEVEIETEE